MTQSKFLHSNFEGFMFLDHNPPALRTVVHVPGPWGERSPTPVLKGLVHACRAPVLTFPDILLVFCHPRMIPIALKVVYYFFALYTFLVEIKFTQFTPKVACFVVI